MIIETFLRIKAQKITFHYQQEVKDWSKKQTPNSSDLLGKSSNKINLKNCDRVLYGRVSYFNTRDSGCVNSRSDGLIEDYFRRSGRLALLVIQVQTDTEFRYHWDYVRYDGYNVTFIMLDYICTT